METFKRHFFSIILFFFVEFKFLSKAKYVFTHKFIVSTFTFNLKIFLLHKILKVCFMRTFSLKLFLIAHSIHYVFLLFQPHVL